MDNEQTSQTQQGNNKGNYVFSGKTKICKQCGTIIDKSLRVCPKCFKKQPNQDLKYIIIGIILFFTVVAIIGNIDDNTQTNNTVTQTPNETTSSQKVDKETKKEEKRPTQKNIFIKEMSSTGDISKITAGKIYTVLHKKLLFKKIEYYERVSDKLSLWDINCDDYSVRIAATNKEISKITCGDYTLYKGNKVICTRKGLNARNLNNNESKYYVIAQEIITNNLKSPSSADFPSFSFSRSDIHIRRYKKLITVSSYVDAQNSFGATIRSNWLVQYKVNNLDNFNYSIQYIQIDDSKQGKYINKF